MSRPNILRMVMGLWLGILPIQAYEAWLTNVRGQTEIRLLNPGFNAISCNVLIYDDMGTLLKKETHSLSPKMLISFKTELNVAAQIQCLAPEKILMETIEQREGSWYEQTGTPAKPAPAFIPHIAIQTDYWETNVTFVAQNHGRFFLENQTNLTALSGPGRHGCHHLNMETYLSANPNNDAGWRSLVSSQALLQGTLSFFNTAGTQSAVLPLHYELNTYLILPHLPTDQNTWWTGLVLVNPGATPAEVTLKWHLEGRPAETTTVHILPGQKLSQLLEQLLPNITGGWAEILSSQPLLGFELFGTRNEQSLCGLPLTQRLTRRHLFSRIGHGDTWSGLAILNPGSDPLSVSLNQYDATGALLRSDDLSIGSHARIRLIPEAQYPVNSATPVWPELISTQSFLAFQLVGNSTQTGLSAMAGTTYGTNSIELGLSQTFVPNPPSTVSPFQMKDVDGDLVPDFVTTTQTGIEMTTQLTTSPQKSQLTYESMELELEGVIPPPLSVTDLNQDGMQEFLILDKDLHIFSRTGEDELTRFQDFLLDLEGADYVAGYADTNRDGFLEILTPRGYYKSLATLKNPYTTNNFPYQLRSSGRASQFMDLNGDSLPDLLTSLFGEIHAFLSYGSTDDLGPPIYVPDPNKAILQMFQKDMDGDGEKDVICLLGDHINNQFGSSFHIVNLHWEDSTFLGSIPLPDDLAIGSLQLLDNGIPGTATFKQSLPYCTRFIEINMEAIQSITYRTGTGNFIDFNGDQIPDQVAPWTWALTEPNSLPRNPAFLFFDEMAASNRTRLYDQADRRYWVSATELIPNASHKITIWEDKGFQRNPEPLQQVNLPISYPGFVTFTDTDGNGLKDILVAGSGLTVYFQEETGFQPEPAFIHTPAVFTIIEAMPCDLDGNQWTDLIGQTIDGSGRLKMVFDYRSPQPKSLTMEEIADLEDLYFTDLNSDGLWDLIIQRPDRPVLAKINSTQQSFTNLTLPQEFKSMVTMDLRGSGLQDIVGYVEPPASNQTYLRVLNNNQNLDFSYGTIQEIQLESPYRKILALDLNNDGRDDLIGFIFSNEPKLDIWLNRWTPETRTPFEFSHSVPIHGAPLPAIRDRNTDGTPDLEFQYPGLRAWLLNKVSYFPQSNQWEPEEP